VLEALADHSKEIAKHTRIQTKNAREKRVRDFIEWLGVDREIKSITRQQAGSYITRVLLNKGHSIKTTKDTISDLSTFFNWCMQRGMIDSNPFYGLSTTVRETSRGTKEKQGTRRRPFTNDELVTLLTAIRDARGKDDPLWPLAILGLFTGMRGNEIAETEVTDVHDTYIHIPEGKTESSIRDVPIHPVISKLVADLKENSTDGYLISGLKRGGEDNKRYHVIGKRFSTVLRKVAKITDRQVVFHCLRKNLATALENAGVPESTAQQIAGHKKQSMTYGLYSGGVELEKLSKAMAKVDYGEAIEKLI
jgi:integrase